MSPTPLPQQAFLPVTLLRPSRQQPRTRFTPARMAELVESIRTHGVLQALLVRPAPNWQAGEPTHEIVAGERRWRAATSAGLAEVPVSIRDLSDADVAEIQLAENIDREDLHPLEEARHLQRLLDSPEGHARYPTHAELAARLGRSEAWIGRRLALCALNDEAATAFLEDRITTATAQVLARLTTPEQQREALAHVLKGWGGEPLSASAIAEWVKKKYLLRLANAPFSHEAAFDHAGPCATCPKRSGARPDLFDDLAGADHCLDADCWDAKHDQHVQALLQAARDLGQKVLEGAKARDFMPSSKVLPADHHWLDKPCPKLTDSKRPLSELMAKNKAVVVLHHPEADLPLYLVPEKAARTALKKAGKLREEAAAPAPAPAAAALGPEPVVAWPFPQKVSTAPPAPATQAKPMSPAELEARIEHDAGTAFCRELLLAIQARMGDEHADLFPIKAILRWAILTIAVDRLSVEGFQLLYGAMGWPCEHGGADQRLLDDTERRLLDLSWPELLDAAAFTLIAEELTDASTLPDLTGMGDSRALDLAHALGIDPEPLWATAQREATEAAQAEQARRQRETDDTTTATGAVLVAQGEAASA